MTSGCTEDIPMTGLTLDKEHVELSPGETVQLTATLIPENTTYDGDILWTSSDESKVSVSPDGLVTAISYGEATVTAAAGEFTAECTISIPLPPASVGDFYYSDGTYSTELDKSKEVIGVVFWTGDPTANDAALKKDHPNCTHGLVVAATGDQESTWQAYYKFYDATIGEWIEANAPEYNTTIAGRGDSDYLNQIVGYNNTKAMELFNADPANSEWPVEAIEKTVAYRSAVPAPEMSSDWYLPSIKELSLLISGEYDGNIYDWNDPVTESIKMINQKMEEAGKETFVSFGYWTSSEDSKTSSFYAGTEKGYVFSYRKGVMNYRVRFVLAF